MFEIVGVVVVVICVILVALVSLLLLCKTIATIIDYLAEYIYRTGNMKLGYHAKTEREVRGFGFQGKRVAIGIFTSKNLKMEKDETDE